MTTGQHYKCTLSGEEKKKMSTVFAWGVDRSETGFDGGDHKVIDLKAMAAEFIVMTLFVIIGCGTACKISVELFLLCVLMCVGRTLGSETESRCSFGTYVSIFFHDIWWGCPEYIHFFLPDECRQAATERLTGPHACWWR